MTDTTAFLTEKRKQVLTGEYPGTEATERSTRSTIKRKSEAAMSELIDVAESDQIENQDVFRTDEVVALLEALFNPARGEYTDEEIPLIETRDDWDPQFKRWSDEMYLKIDGLLRAYHGLHGTDD